MTLLEWNRDVLKFELLNVLFVVVTDVELALHKKVNLGYGALILPLNHLGREFDRLKLPEEINHKLIVSIGAVVL